MGLNFLGDHAKIKKNLTSNIIRIIYMITEHNAKHVIDNKFKSNFRLFNKNWPWKSFNKHPGKKIYLILKFLN